MQNTAYEMLSSDLSSDMCSSDLADHRYSGNKKSAAKTRASDGAPLERFAPKCKPPRGRPSHVPGRALRHCAVPFPCGIGSRTKPIAKRGYPMATQLKRNSKYSEAEWTARQELRSEENTSELQSLMRISYAVFCLKKTTEN